MLSNKPFKAVVLFSFFSIIITTKVTVAGVLNEPLPHGCYQVPITVRGVHYQFSCNIVGRDLLYKKATEDSAIIAIYGEVSTSNHVTMTEAGMNEKEELEFTMNFWAL